MPTATKKRSTKATTSVQTGGLFGKPLYKIAFDEIIDTFEIHKENRTIQWLKWTMDNRQQSGFPLQLNFDEDIKDDNNYKTLVIRVRHTTPLKSYVWYFIMYVLKPKDGPFHIFFQDTIRAQTSANAGFDGKTGKRIMRIDYNRGKCYPNTYTLDYNRIIKADATNIMQTPLYDIINSFVSSTLRVDFKLVFNAKDQQSGENQFTQNNLMIDKSKTALSNVFTWIKNKNDADKTSVVQPQQMSISDTKKTAYEFRVEQFDQELYNVAVHKDVTLPNTTITFKDTSGKNIDPNNENHELLKTFIKYMGSSDIKVHCAAGIRIIKKASSRFSSDEMIYRIVYIVSANRQRHVAEPVYVKLFVKDPATNVMTQNSNTHLFSVFSPPKAVLEQHVVESLIKQLYGSDCECIGYTYHDDANEFFKSLDEAMPTRYNTTFDPNAVPFIFAGGAKKGRRSTPQSAKTPATSSSARSNSKLALPASAPVSASTPAKARKTPRIRSA